MNNERLFSLAEVNALLPRIALIMEKMQHLGLHIRQEIEQLTQNFSQCAHDLSIAQLLHLKPDLHPLFEKLAQGIQEIEQLGGVFKGLELGLVDFPARIEGEEVELCWQYGEKEIAYYHRRDEGFAGRRLLKQTLNARSYH